MSKLDKIFNKIEDIRKQPEHIRIRWVWGLTFASMILVVIIWMLSIASMRDSSSGQNNSDQGQELFNEFKNQGESIRDASGQIKSILEQGEELQNSENLLETKSENTPDSKEEGFSAD